MIDKRVLESRKKAYAEINSVLRSTTEPINASSLGIMVGENHGFTRRFSDEYLRMLADTGEVKLIISDNGRILTAQLIR